jgi:hypothetical protein
MGPARHAERARDRLCEMRLLALMLALGIAAIALLLLARDSGVTGTRPRAIENAHIDAASNDKLERVLADSHADSPARPIRSGAGRGTPVRTGAGSTR